MNNIEAKLKILAAGKSKVFKNWQSLLPNMTEEMFAKALMWVCADERDKQGKLTREIGLTRIGIVKLKRVNNYLTEIRYLDGRLWEGDFFRVQCSDTRYVDKDGTITERHKISISAEDRV